jgi:hypothetical protein
MKGRQGTLKSSNRFKCLILGQIAYFVLFCLLCCPELTPQIVGAIVVAPSTVKVSVQVPTVGGAFVNETKSNLFQ